MLEGLRTVSAKLCASGLAMHAERHTYIIVHCLKRQGATGGSCFCSNSPAHVAAPQLVLCTAHSCSQDACHAAKPLLLLHGHAS